MAIDVLKDRTQTPQRTDAQAQAQVEQPRSPRPARILIADDESRIRLALRACLEADGYEVLEAADGLEAMDDIIHAAPDVMILDLAMPNLDGIRTVDHLSGVHGQLKPKIIILTAFASGPAMLKTLGLGASLFLEKPVTPDVLRSAVQKVLSEDLDTPGGIPIDWTAVLREEEQGHRPH
jgi:two-component system KDP operon response regulator KdpE